MKFIFGVGDKPTYFLDYLMDDYLMFDSGTIIGISDFCLLIEEQVPEWPKNRSVDL